MGLLLFSGGMVLLREKPQWARQGWAVSLTEIVKIEDIIPPFHGSPRRRHAATKPTDVIGFTETFG